MTIQLMILWILLRNMWLTYGRYCDMGCQFGLSCDQPAYVQYSIIVGTVQYAQCSDPYTPLNWPGACVS